MQTPFTPGMVSFLAALKPGTTFGTHAKRIRTSCGGLRAVNLMPAPTAVSQRMFRSSQTTSSRSILSAFL
jgi:hypothetical protein